MTPTKLSQHKHNLPPFFLVAACDPDGKIGFKGKLPWGTNYPEDLAHFREVTKGQIIIMGRKTYDSLPLSVFKSRTCCVLTHSTAINPLLAFPIKNIQDLERLYEMNPTFSMKTSWVIGGGEIFEFFLKKNLVKEAIITHLKVRYAGDVRFPLDYLKEWSQELIRETPSFSIIRYGNPTF